MEKWEAYAECADGTTIKKFFNYTGYPTYTAEQNRQHEIEAWLIEVACEKHGGCEFYSVSYTDCYDPEWDIEEGV